MTWPSTPQVWFVGDERVKPEALSALGDELGCMSGVLRQQLERGVQLFLRAEGAELRRVGATHPLSDREQLPHAWYALQFSGPPVGEREA